MTYFNRENEHLRIGRRGPVFAPVSRCVPSFGVGQRPCPGEGFRASFGRIFVDFPGSAEGEGRGRRKALALFAPTPFAAARSADCHEGLRRFEIDADYRAPNVLWRYSL